MNMRIVKMIDVAFQGGKENIGLSHKVMTDA